MLVKSRVLRRIIFLICLVNASALTNASVVNWATSTAYAADAMATQSLSTDRISFYNVPSDHKLEIQLDYADGKVEKIKYPSPLCAAGTVITRDLNLYTAKFVAQGCDTTVFQNLNLRWMGDCQFELEHDPDLRILAGGPYGESILVDGHYPAGRLQLTNLPTNTTTLSATMIYTNTQGIVQTGNVTFAFHAPQPGCTPTPLATPTQSVTPTVPTQTPIPIAPATATVTASLNTATPTAEAIVGLSSTPTPTSTPTATPTPAVSAPTASAPTGLDPSDEPKAPESLTVYLPFVKK